MTRLSRACRSALRHFPGLRIKAHVDMRVQSRSERPEHVTIHSNSVQLDESRLVGQIHGFVKSYNQRTPGNRISDEPG